MIKSILALLAQLVAAIADLFTGIVKWVRKKRTPVQKWQLACFVLGLAFLSSSFVAWDRQQAVLVVVAESQKAADDYARTIQSKDDVIEEQRSALQRYVNQEKRFVDAARLEATRLEQARQQSAEAMAAVEKAKEEAEENNRKWWAEYNKRPETCQAALEALDVACPSLGDY